MIKIVKFRLIVISLISAVLLILSGCEKPESPKEVSNEFWQAVQSRDMETAKLYSSWETVDYLKYLKAEKLHPERFELGDEIRGDTRSEVVTVLFTSKQGEAGIKLPAITVLVMTSHGWRVNVKKTMTSVLKYTANNVFDQLSGLLQEGIKELDNSLSESMNELGKALEEGTNELKRELSKPLFNPEKAQPNSGKHSGKQI